MNTEHLDRAAILAEAMSYIQKYNGKTIVVKYGGNAMTSPELFDAVMRDLVLLSLVGMNVVVVHGGGPEINETIQKIGMEPRFVNGLRYTDEATMDVVQMVLCGKVNKNLVNTLGQFGGRALGLCGLDGGMLQAVRYQAEDGSDLGLVGELVGVNPAPVKDALENGYIPVIATVAQGTDGADAYNINADIAASKLAIALGAQKLILLTDVRGLLRDPKDENSLYPSVQVSEVPRLMKDGIVSGGMIPKLSCCVESVRQGVGDALILDGRIPHSILVELFTESGVGTLILP